jgi:LysM repeat protein
MLSLRWFIILVTLVTLTTLTSCQTRYSANKAPPYSAETIKHEVMVGETITMVATRYSVSVSSIIDANNLRDRFLKPGTILYIPGGKMPAPEPVIAPPTNDTPPALVETKKDTWFVPRSNWTKQAINVKLTTPMGGTPTRITVHHSGDVKDVQFDSREWLQRIDLNHIRGINHPEPWACIGYHFIIDTSGRVFEGRPMKYQGAHAGNNEVNRLNIGICLIGDFERQRVPQEQRRALLETLDRLCLDYGINRSAVFGHKHFRVTACPGKNLSAIIDAYADRPEAVEENDVRQAALPVGATRLGEFIPTKR